MFTGIIEELGAMEEVYKQGQTMRMTISANRILEDAHRGDSIAVNGVCLTITDLYPGKFTVDVMPETYRRSTLHQLNRGGRVNLERAMSVRSRFGGHIVQGHVDTVAKIRKRRAEENAVVFSLALVNADYMRYIIPHGSITIDGISLTVVDVSESEVNVSIIPHTLANTVLQHKEAGSVVNIECDVLGKYVERLLSFPGSANRRAPSGPADHRRDPSKSAEALDETFLSRHGFL